MSAHLYPRFSSQSLRSLFAIDTSRGRSTFHRRSPHPKHAGEKEKPPPPPPLHIDYVSTRPRGIAASTFKLSARNGIELAAETHRLEDREERESVCVFRAREVLFLSLGKREKKDEKFRRIWNSPGISPPVSRCLFFFLLFFAANR